VHRTLSYLSNAMVLASATLVESPVTSARAASLEAWAGVVGGAGTGSIPNNCTTFGPPAELAPMFESQSLGMQVLGGNTTCGYSGGWTDLTAASGPLPNSASLAPVILGNPGFSGYFDGTSNSTANYASLSAWAHANISGGTPGSPVALFDSQGASFFTDALSVTSPMLVNGSAAFVQYLFAVNGSFSALGTPGPFLFGNTYGQLSLTMNGGPVYGIMSATVSRGGTGSVLGGTPPAGWTTSQGQLSGSGTFESLRLPVVVGQQWVLNVGLLDWAYGTADSSLGATLAGIQRLAVQSSLRLQPDVDVGNAVRPRTQHRIAGGRRPGRLGRSKAPIGLTARASRPGDPGSCCSSAPVSQAPRPSERVAHDCSGHIITRHRHAPASVCASSFLRWGIAVRRHRARGVSLIGTISKG